MSSHSNLCSYTTLANDCIRILELQPGNYGDPLYGNLRSISLRTYGDNRPNAASLLTETDPGLEIAAALTASIYGGFESMVADLDSMPEGDEYDALSYACGPGGKTHEIIIGSDGIVPIQQSLHSALQHVRLSDRVRNVWADAVCIDQADNDEKAAQVAMMGTIYKQARRVVVWLGQSEGLDWLAFNLLEAFDERRANSAELATWLEIQEEVSTLQPRCTCCTQRTIHTDSAVLDVAFQTINTIVSRSWFTRLWVVQEALLAKEICFQSGSHIIQARPLIGLTMYRDREDALQSLLSEETIRGIIESWAPVRMLFINMSTSLIHQHRSTLLETLTAIGDRVCSHPLDRVYAIRSVCCLSQWPELDPDYNIRPLKLYKKLVVLALTRDTELTIWNVRQGGSIHPSAFLAMASTNAMDPSEKIWPSWIPNFHHIPPGITSTITKVYPGHPDVNREEESGPFTPYALTFQYQQTSSDKTDVLSIWGHVCGEVSAILPNSRLNDVDGCHVLYEPTEGNEISFTNQTAIEKWALSCAQFVRTYRRSSDIIPPRGPSREMKLFVDNLRWLAEDDGSANAKERFMDYFNRLLDKRWAQLDLDKCLAAVKIREETFIGWLPKTAVEGDRICILFGAPHPFIIRPRSDLESYQLIGDARIDALNEEVAVDEDKEIMTWIRAYESLYVKFSVGTLERQDFATGLDHLNREKPSREWIDIA